MSSRNRNKSENNSINLEITEKQQEFIEAEATEVLFGGAAGGGKSYGQVIDAMLYALKYPKSKQIIFRKTYPELERLFCVQCLRFIREGNIPTIKRRTRSRLSTAA